MAKTELFKARDDPTEVEILVIHKTGQKVPDVDGWELVENSTELHGVKKLYRRLDA